MIPFAAVWLTKVTLVTFVNYRLSPEHHFPVAYTANRWKGSVLFVLSFLLELQGEM
jgi:hypothetical protein